MKRRAAREKSESAGSMSTAQRGELTRLQRVAEPGVFEWNVFGSGVFVQAGVGPYAILPVREPSRYVRRSILAG